MRSVPVLLATAAILSAAPASADSSKAWQAAKDHLPATIPAIGGVDVAALAKLPAFGKLLDLVKKEEREAREAFALLERACSLDPVKAVDGFVVAGDPDGRDDDIMIFLQLTIDRTKASSCMESMLKTVGGKKPISVKQNGIYTEASVDGDTAYFAWVAPNVVAFNADPGKKARLEGFLNKKGLAKSPVGALLGKLDPKAVAAGAIKLAKPDSDLPVTSGYGSATLAGQNASANLVGTFADAATATKIVEEIKKELAREVKRDKTPAAIKKIINAVTITAAGADVTVKGTANTSELVDAVMMMFVKKEDKKAAEPPPAETAPAPARARK